MIKDGIRPLNKKDVNTLGMATATWHWSVNFDVIIERRPFQTRMVAHIAITIFAVTVDYCGKVRTRLLNVL